MLDIFHPSLSPDYIKEKNIPHCCDLNEATGIIPQMVWASLICLLCVYVEKGWTFQMGFECLALLGSFQNHRPSPYVKTLVNNN